MVYIGYSIWDIGNGFSGKGSFTEQEISDISSTWSNYFNNQESKSIKWEICSSYFAEAIYDDPVSNQYNVNVDCLYENEKKKYGFTLLKGLNKYHIDTVQQFYVYPDEK